MSWLSKNFIGTNKNPANAANQYLGKIPGAMNPYFQPYIDKGTQAGNQLTEQYNQMTQNPGGFMSKIAEGYKESPGYQFKLHQALQAGNQSAAAGGMLGTPMNQQQNMQTANDIASGDFNDYMKNLMAMFGMGQQGQQTQQQQGFDASTRYGENLGNVLGQQGQYGYAGQAGENQNRSNNWANLFKGVGMIAPWFMGA